MASLATPQSPTDDASFLTVTELASSVTAWTLESESDSDGTWDLDLGADAAADAWAPSASPPRRDVGHARAAADGSPLSASPPRCDIDASPSTASPRRPALHIGRVCARAAAASARARDRALAMARADEYLDADGAAGAAHAARQVRLDHLRRECASLRLSAALVLASAPDAVAADADDLLEQGYAADEVLAVVAATRPAAAAAARRHWEVDADAATPPRSGVAHRERTLARGLVGLFFGDGTMAGLARCAAACDPTDFPRDMGTLRLLSYPQFALPREIARLIGAFALTSPLARFAARGRVSADALARLLRPHLDGVVGRLKRTKHFGRVVAVARGANVALSKAPRPKKKPPPEPRRNAPPIRRDPRGARWNASSIRRDPRGVARHCLRGARGRRCLCVECWNAGGVIIK